MGTAFLGLTLDCAKCHDHNYDAITQVDYYRLFAFFNNVPERGLYGGKPLYGDPAIKAPTEEQLAAIAAADAEIADLRAALDAPDPEADRAQAAWERELAARAKDGAKIWEVLAPEKAEATGGVTLERQGDLSVLAKGTNPSTTVYTIEARTAAASLTGIRLEALTDPSLPMNGPGRYPSNANAVMNFIEVTAAPLSGRGKPVSVKLAEAKADHAQRDYPVAGALNPSGGNGWGIHKEGAAMHERRVAAFRAAQPFGFPGGTRLQVKLHFESKHGGHSLGRVRLSATSGPDPVGALLADGEDPLVAVAAKPAAQRSEAEKAALRGAFRAAHWEKAKDLNQQIAKLEAEKKAAEDGAPMTMVMAELPQPRATHILERGQYDKKGDQVTAGTPAELPPMPEGAPNNRLGLAQWLTAPDNPLFARVAVNRFWQQLFGTGFVATAEDFGAQGEWPSHPELLDWLSVEFRESGWDVKALLKLIVTSAAYQQDSAANPAALERDPHNRLLARGPRARLSGEAIRDAALAASGLLVEKVGGPSVKPYQPDGLWAVLTIRPGFQMKYQPGTGDDLYRRSLYTFWKRAQHPPAMQAFDAPNREVCVAQRQPTNTPLQALVLLHDPTFVEAARALAGRMMREGGTDPAERLAWGFEAVTARRPTSDEQQILLATFTDALNEFRADPARAEALLKTGESPRDASLDPVVHAAYASVARVVLNLSEAVTKE
ncbi:MAG: DUF1553 domain-containing protein [Verrucomicrobiales bacterium]